MNIKEVRKYVSAIKGNLFKNSNSYSIGNLKSHFKGTGLQFKEHQVYSHGDDVRFIDWKILAKTAHPYVKTFEEERNVEIVVFIDASPCMFVGCDGVSKLQAAIEITCLLYLLASQTNDYIHTIFLYDKVYNLPAKNGDEGVIILTSLLEKIGVLEDGKVITTDRIPEQVRVGREKIRMNDILRHLKKKREVVILSDLQTLVEDIELSSITKNANMHCFQILSPIELTGNNKYRLHSWGLDGSQASTGFIDKVNTKVEGLKKKKILNVSERYLEQFVKEML
jgi:uncharacterized protein (DUF58 family)